ncbi:MAG: ATP-dependent helicase DeaD [Eubacteriaceae bacterium]|nr:ATP-dependent helicase DeaD [Eubacteriaceae bacterium]MDK2935412.1 ATP-dependent helicase DeaD [Eubacteriaceae bacterium]MDN5306985.1 ATP-dependent helicase DeaD [Eubacteriaceae bacterium]
MINNQFNQYQLSESILKAIEKLGYQEATPVQQAVIPTALEKKDILCQAQTGSGKTAAFAIPICQQLDWEENSPQVLVLTPTRELALQVHEDIFNIGRFKRVKVSALYGKSPIKRQERELKQKTHVVVGTPGRVMDHIDRGNLKTDQIKWLILDEADEMLNMGFIDQVEEIIETLPKERVTMLFSATMEEAVIRLSKNYMKDPQLIEIKSQVSNQATIKQMICRGSQKLELLSDLLITENPESAIIFCNTREVVNAIYNELGKSNQAFGKIHGGMEQDERTLVMNRFKKGEFRYLIATDVAARGIDVHDIELVINYDVPWETETYVHRIGRTGRRGTNGKAITLASNRDSRLVEEIIQFTGQEMIEKDAPKDEEVALQKAAYLEKLNRKPEEKLDKAHALTKEITKLHINAGKKTKMRPVDIVGTLCSLEGMSADDIGVITILDVSTFVEILNNKGDQVLKALQTKEIKGRLRKVSLAEDKPVVSRRRKNNFRKRP